jgi:hypothetical protein
MLGPSPSPCAAGVARVVAIRAVLADPDPAVTWCHGSWPRSRYWDHGLNWSGHPTGVRQRQDGPNRPHKKGSARAAAGNIVILTLWKSLILAR